MSDPTFIPESYQPRLKAFALGSIVLGAGFSTTLFALARYSLHEELFSYIMLVPLVAGYLISQRRRDLDWTYSKSVGIPVALFAAALVCGFLSFRQAGPAAETEIITLSLRTLAFVFSWIAVAVWTLGSRFMRGLAFPAAFLLFLTPLPPDLVELLERWLQHASAEAASWLFPLADVPNFRTGLTFQLPNVTIQVAPECSGIRSSLVLFITSLVAGQLLLERPWQRAVLSLLVIPLGIFRNAFRIVTLGWLCMHYGPEMIHSPLHHRGGPVFFAISLLPLFAMLFVFRKFGKRREPSRSSAKD